MGKKRSLQVMVEISLLAALTFVIDLFIPSIKPLPSVSSSVSFNFSMIPIFILAFRRGVIPSAIAGMIWGLLQIITGEAWMVHPIQVILEYIIALAFISLSGLFKNQIQKEIFSGNKNSGLVIMGISVFVGSLSRYFWHFLAGYFFWVDILKIPEEKALFFSFWTNGLSGIGSGTLCIVIIGLLFSTSPRMIKQSL